MSRRFYQITFLALAFSLCFTFLRPTAFSAAPTSSAPGPRAYSLTYTTRQVEGGVPFNSIVKVYREAGKAAVVITNLPNAKLPQGTHDFYVMNLRAHKSREWSPGDTDCTVSNFSGNSWSYNPFAGPMPFKGMLNPLLDKSLPFKGHQVGTATVIGLQSRVYEVTFPPPLRSKLWVEARYGLVLKSAKLGKDGRYHASSDIVVTKFSPTQPPASAFALGGPCGGSAAPSHASGTGASGAGAPAATAGIAVPQGNQLEIKWKGGSPLKLKPPEEVAFIVLVSIDNLQDQCQLFFQKFCTLPELVKGMKTSQGVIGLSVNPAQDKNYHYAVGISGKEFAISARPARPGVGGWLWIQHEFGHDLYFNPQGTATGKNKKVGNYSLNADFTRQ